MTITASRQLRAGLIGSGIKASLTPAMHMAEGREQGLSYRYDLLDLAEMAEEPDQLQTLLSFAEDEHFAGLNITHPCKQAVIPLLDSLTPDAAALGAVNTVVLRNGRREGHNTDWWGFAESFKRGLPDVELGRAVQLGAGGAGAATAYAALRLGVGQLTVFDMDKSRAEDLAAKLQPLFPDATLVAGDDLFQALQEANGLIHATPTGMDKYPGLPLAAELLHENLWVAEIVYFPIETALLAEARRRGCRVLDGGGMATFQAVGAFSLFTGHTADAERMRRHFLSLTR
ncbi:shikimate dehydrogenase [Agrobacterium sp. a22-2]|uniref:shikimate dehydrogenase n=1 Tax=Agrobacterium sp. a22-2 TaxID=2283840 RepID=UPI001445F964|nr:shikimate dehydrogenase [Agrobacterium sp. a22-2]NKN35799.1 shikimate dehydrogenase [Agrobacterium sp. a22-2]